VFPNGAQAWVTPNSNQAPRVCWDMPGPRQVAQVPRVYRGMLSAPLAWRLSPATSSHAPTNCALHK